MSLPTALELKELVRIPADTATILRVATLNAIYAACTTPSTIPLITTGSVSTGSATESQIIALVSELQQAGFTVTLSTGSFTVSWQR